MTPLILEITALQYVVIQDFWKELAKTLFIGVQITFKLSKSRYVSDGWQSSFKVNLQRRKVF